MTHLALGAFLGLMIGTALHLPPDYMWCAAVGGGITYYLGSCWRFPFTKCWWCGGDLKRGDGSGNYRRKGCLVCGGAPYVRLGARFLGRG